MQHASMHPTCLKSLDPKPTPAKECCATCKLPAALLKHYSHTLMCETNVPAEQSTAFFSGGQQLGALCMTQASAKKLLHLLSNTRQPQNMASLRLIKDLMPSEWAMQLSRMTTASFKVALQSSLWPSASARYRKVSASHRNALRQPHALL